MFVKKDVRELDMNPFGAIGEGWMLIGACADGKANAMTASWGALGVLWGKNVFYCHVRPQRYTFSLAEKTDILTLSVFESGEYRKELGFFGRASGRDTDKLSSGGLTFIRDGEKVYCGEAKTVLVGKKLYSSFFDPEKFISPEIETHYNNGDYHKTYVCEITECLVNMK